MNTDSEAATFNQYYIVGQDCWLTAHVKNVILKNQNTICPVFKSLSSLYDSHMRSTTNKTLVLIDISVVTVEDLLKLISAHQLKSDGYLNLPFVFYNVSKNALAFPFLCIPGIRGFLQKEIDDALLVESIRAISRGAQWYPLEFLNEVTGGERADADTSTTESMQLTGWERAVLKHMSAGASDSDIADNAKGDSSIVKQQIGVIYKKLNFKNHTTAARIAGGLALQ